MLIYKFEITIFLNSKEKMHNKKQMGSAKKKIYPDTGFVLVFIVVVFSKH